MSSLAPKRLTGWLILLIIYVGPLQFGGPARSLSAVPDLLRPRLAEYPSLSKAIMVFQLLMGGSIAIWACTAWLLYRCGPGTLKTVQTSFLVGGALRVVAGFSVPLLGGLPPDATRSMIQQSLPGTSFLIGWIAVWYLYLVRSERVSDIYAA